MNTLQATESLCKEISIQKNLYRKASERDENLEVKKKILVRLRALEKELIKLNLPARELSH